MIDRSRRARLARLVGKLGSDSETERAAAVDAIGKAIDGNWAWLCDVVAGRERLPDERVKLYEALVEGRLAELYVLNWSMTAAEKSTVGKVAAAIAGGVGIWDLPVADVTAAIEVGESVRARDPGRGPRVSNWR